MDPRSAGGVGRNTASQRSADSAAADRNSRGGTGLTRAQETALALGRTVPQPPSTDQAPTIAHSTGPTGPRPGTADRWGTSVGQAPDIQRQQTDYNNAADNMQNRGFTGWLGDRALDMIPGFHQVTPQWNKPATYANGIYHDAWSPVSAALSLAGTASPVPAGGLAMSQIGDAATSAFNLPDYKFGGGGWNPSTANPIEKAFGPATNPYGPADQTKSPQLGNPTQGGGMAAFPTTQAPGGAPFGPQPGAPSPGTPQGTPNPMAAFFNPKVANHSLPQGYQSLFPNSLSDADKALLYGKALAG